ncbi:Sugar fermentation stimulation protein A [Neomoorella glycerini]|uniref:Sugar fermentation stimulation protein homolog n=1 Tax=Neomoorella glycerini TaxID=55779 RepID=A0A6I5ZRW7_9FIRM|nr:DNA/RNA nuclease SfsA [Moorella glycerini]QGP92307.1 Sugar fermentation stimulation protein A [Moorella glycerini]
MVKLPENLIKARFLIRPNRFTVIAEKAGQQVKAFLADPGRLAELLLPGTELYLAPAQAGVKRKTVYDVVLLHRDGTFISLDSHLPNRLFAAAFHTGGLEAFQGYRQLTAEVRAGSSRLDFLLTVGGEKEAGLHVEGLPPCYVEVKSVTLVNSEKVALFPDAPTSRGSRHLQELMALRYRGCRAAVVFIIQREDTSSFAPNEATDPLFAWTLRETVAAGVEVYAYRCRISPVAACLSDPVPVKLT